MSSSLGVCAITAASILLKTTNGAFAAEATGDITISTGGSMSRVANGDINDESISGSYTLTTGNAINATTKNGPISIMATGGDINIGSSTGRTNLKSQSCLCLDAPRLKLRNSIGIYGTVEPSDLGLTNLEEGTLYFKLLD